MGKTVTFGHILIIISILVLPLIGWGVLVETRFTENKERDNQSIRDITVLKKEIKVLQEDTNENYIKILKELTEIRLELKDKKDRK